jgi:membrane protease YdiL (CAAX protease family)
MENPESFEPVLPPRPRITWIDRVQAAFEVLLISGLPSGVLASLPFAFHPGAPASLLADVRVLIRYILLETLLAILFLVLVLKAHREKLRDLGFFSRRWFREAAIGLSVIPVLFAANIVTALLFQHFFPRYLMERNPLADLIRTPGDLMLFIGTVLISGGIKEELQRAFILRRFQVYLGGAWLGLFLWSIAFGCGHYLQGLQGLVTASILGLIFGTLYLVRQNLIAPIVAHGIYDTIVLLSYWQLVPHK